MLVPLKSWRAQGATIAPWAILFLSILMLQASGILVPVDRAISDLRFRLTDRQASGEIVFAAIDKRSLDAVGTWPWPRSVHAQLTDRLVEAGAREVVFDIDFSTPSVPAEDLRFAESLERAAGRVTLPVFLQASDAAGNGPDRVQVTAPIDMLAEHAWLASVNVFPDSDGIVRTFPRGVAIAGVLVPSIPVSLARSEPDPEKSTLIDYGIDPASIPAASVAEILFGDANTLGRFAGKTLVIGAYATELGDFYAVPRYGFIPGAVVQIMAAETELAGRRLVPVTGLPITTIAFALAVLAIFALRNRSLSSCSVAMAGLSLAGEGAAAFGYLSSALWIPTAVIHVVTFATLMFHALVTNDFFRAVVQDLSAETRKMRVLLTGIFRDNFDAIIILGPDGNVIENSTATLRILDPGGTLPADKRVPADFIPRKIHTEALRAIEAHLAGRAAEKTAGFCTIASGDEERYLEYTISITEAGKTARRNRNQDRRGDDQVAACITARDVTERHFLEERLTWLSRNDELTLTQHRHAFMDAIDDALADGDTPGIAVLAFNLHRFKTINIALGRDAGDALLQQVARRVVESDEPAAAMARLGGDSFAVLLSPVSNEEEARTKADNLFQMLVNPYPAARGVNHIGIQMGLHFLTRSRVERINAADVLAGAETALDEARLSPGSRIVVFNGRLAEAHKRSRIIERDLWLATEAEQIRLAYQVQIDCATRLPVGAEALIRWNHPALGAVRPDEFIPIAEANGIISDLGRWVLVTACREAASWPSHLGVSVNVAPQQIVNDDIVADVEQALWFSGLTADRLTLEIVESDFLEVTDALLEKIRHLKEMGVSIALDDFGTGYSGMSYLSALPFDKLKIDRQFIRPLGENPAAEGVIRAVKTLADAHSLRIVCEGIETEQQEACVRTIGCQEGQGYLYSKPVDAAEFRALVGNGTRPLAIPVDKPNNVIVLPTTTKAS